MDKFTVYKITNIVNNKIYIGYTKNKIDVRLRGHFKKAKIYRNHKFSNAILKYGQINFIIEPIFESFDKKEALEKEIFFIKEYDSIKKGYNISTGGESGANGVTGRKLSDSHKEKLRLANINKKVSNETKELISKNHADVSGIKNPFFNKKHSNETKVKIANRKYSKGKEHHFYGKKIATSFKEGKEHPKSQTVIIDGIEYGSLTLAAKALGISRPTIKKRYVNGESNQI